MSFFGFDPNLPNNRSIERPNAIDGSAVDELMESKFAYAVDGLDGLEDEAANLLLNDDSDLNEETFGITADQGILC